MRTAIIAIISVLVGILIFFAFVYAASQALARSGPEWANAPQNIRQWFQSLMQPDNPLMSCCGEADSFEVDDFDAEGDHYVAVVTDGRGMIADGARIPVPNSKIKWDKGNPTGHGYIFLSGIVPPNDPRYVYVVVDGKARILYCFVPPGGA